MPDPAEREPTVRTVAETDPAFTPRDWCEAILEYGEVKLLDEPEDAGKTWYGQEVLGISWQHGASPIKYKLCRVEMPGSDRWLPYTLYVLNVHPRPQSHLLMEAFHHHSDTGRTYKRDTHGKWLTRNGERDYVGLNAELVRHLQTAPEEWWPHHNRLRLPDRSVDAAFTVITSALTEARPRGLWRRNGLLRLLKIGAP